MRRKALDLRITTDNQNKKPERPDYMTQYQVNDMINQAFTRLNITVIKPKGMHITTQYDPLTIDSRPVRQEEIVSEAAKLNNKKVLEEVSNMIIRELGKQFKKLDIAVDEEGNKITVTLIKPALRIIGKRSRDDSTEEATERISRETSTAIKNKTRGQEDDLLKVIECTCGSNSDHYSGHTDICPKAEELFNNQYKSE